MAQLIAAGPFATEGERRAAEVLKQLPNDWVVICNKVLPHGDRSHEIDFIILGNRWVFLLDEKSWKGKIHGNDQLWVKSDGFSLPSPLTKADFVAKILAGHLSWKVMPLKENGHFVRGGVLLSITEKMPQIHDPRAANGIYLASNVCERLQTLDHQGGNPQVGQLRTHIQKALIDLSPRPQVPQRINTILIEDAVAIRPGVRLFNGKFEGGQDKAIQLMVYDLTRDPVNAQSLHDFYMRECNALRKLDGTGLVPVVNVPFKWSEDFLIVPILPPRGKFLSVMPLAETSEEFIQELLLAAACFGALDQIHAHGVLHRAIGPGSICIQPSFKVVFTNFYAARVDENSIAPALDALAIEDPYAALDLALGYGYATTTTDTFSLGLVFLERLTGVSLPNIRANVESDIVFPQQPRWTTFLSADLAEELSTLFKQVLTPEKGVPPLTAKEMAARLTELARRMRVEVQGDNVTGKILDKRYKVQRLLGRGTTACTYLATDTEFESLGWFALKQYMSPLHVLEQAAAEFALMRNIQSKYLPRIFDIYPAQNDVHIKMEYIPGPTLQQVENEFPWPLDRWWSFAQDLLNAVEVLEQKQLLHRDIKPANIILHDAENHPVLIDFGFAVREGTRTKLAGTPLYLPPETLATSAAAAFPASCDRYAVGMVLFKALFGYLPFTQLGTERHPISLEQISEPRTRRIAAVLLKTVSADPAERPVSIEQTRQELQTAFLAIDEPIPLPTLQELNNAWVNEIRSLYRNSEIGNKNNRGLDSDFVRETYVPTALDGRLLPKLFAHKPKVVFLCGNPGDGKTAFLEKIQQELEQRQARPIKQDPSGWEWELDGHRYRSCYDASEAHGLLNADQQLTEKLSGLEGRAQPAAPLTVLVAINDGRLVDYFQRHAEQFPWLARQLEKAQEASEVKNLDVWVVDLKKRAFVGLPEAEEKSVFRKVLQRLVAPERWEICEQCVAQAVCPLRNNAASLRLPRVAQRLEYLFLLSHLRRQRHTTMRDLRSALAYLITGNKSCEQVHEAVRGSDAGASLVQLSYWQSAFAPLEESDEALMDLAPLDPARFSHPHLDRFLHFHQGLQDAEQRRLLFRDKKDLEPQRFPDEAAWLAAFKRRAYFEAGKAAAPDGVLLPKVRWLNLLPYRYSRDFMRLLDERLEEEEGKTLKEELALGILRSDGIVEDVPEGMLSVKVSASEEQQLVILKQLPLTEFELLVEEPHNTDMIECLPEIVLFQHRSGTPRLEITVDLFELLLRMADGLQPTSPEFRPLLEDLRLFKDVLLLHETRNLVLIENQQRMHLITQRDHKIIRTRLS
ncbi:protein kinase [Ktedonobacter sp. SOSP1-85]|uniref:protein kinase domain-containing protein n=1 Tax=Ktedonobacter sp. SOSP1-85 TaxID=2778367 RepID=UPI001916AF90|nr:NERD domain-containing protein [Ktedonobacter sp. SOSP1-85]GHO73959.1 protein kinase [Ktedonobacter sp. SOSP1-85]